MDCYELFDEHIKKAAEAFKAIDKKEVIRVISHLDADGISACSIMIKLLNNDNRKYSVSIVQQLNRAVVSQLAAELYNCYIFTDIGSGAINDVKEMLNGKKVFIIDHHSIEQRDERERAKRSSTHLHPSDLSASMLDMESEPASFPRGQHDPHTFLAQNSNDFGSIVLVNPHIYDIDGGNFIEIYLSVCKTGI